MKETKEKEEEKKGSERSGRKRDLVVGTAALGTGIGLLSKSCFKKHASSGRAVPKKVVEDVVKTVEEKAPEKTRKGVSDAVFNHVVRKQNERHASRRGYQSGAGWFGHSGQARAFSNMNNMIDQKLFSTGNSDLDDILQEVYFSGLEDGYQYFQRSFTEPKPEEEENEKEAKRRKVGNAVAAGAIGTGVAAAGATKLLQRGVKNRAKKEIGVLTDMHNAEWSDLKGRTTKAIDAVSDKLRRDSDAIPGREEHTERDLMDKISGWVKGKKKARAVKKLEASAAEEKKSILSGYSRENDKLRAHYDNLKVGVENSADAKSRSIGKVGLGVAGAGLAIGGGILAARGIKAYKAKKAAAKKAAEEQASSESSEGAKAPRLVPSRPQPRA